MNEKIFGISYFLDVLAPIFLIAGIFIPIYFGFKFGNVLNDNPSIILIPIYFGFICVVFSALCYCESLIIKRPSDDSFWLENTLKVFGTVLIILGILSCIIAVAKSSNSFSYIENMGIIGGIAALMLNLVLGGLCFGLAEIHNKYNENDPKVDLSRIENKAGSKSSYCSNCGLEFSPSMKGGFCQECGNKL